MRPVTRLRPRITVAALSAAATLGGSGALAALGPRQCRKSLERSNFHGRAVSLRGGIGAAVGATAAGSITGRLTHPQVGARHSAAAVVAVTAAGTAGLVDDLDAGAHDGAEVAKGLKGHLGALTQGRVTTGVLKIAVIGSGAMVAGVLLARSRAAGKALPAIATDAAGSAVVIASWANVLNLLDLRPGRALKATALMAALLAASPGRAAATTRLLAAGALGTAAAAAPEDLAERTMLGDTGANALGALVGTALAAHPDARLRALAAAGGVALVLASEKVSFTRIIESTPVLAALDSLGRRPS